MVAVLKQSFQPAILGSLTLTPNRSNDHEYYMRTTTYEFQSWSEPHSGMIGQVVPVVRLRTWCDGQWKVTRVSERPAEWIPRGRVQMVFASDARFAQPGQRAHETPEPFWLYTERMNSLKVLIWCGQCGAYGPKYSRFEPQFKRCDCPELQLVGSALVPVRRAEMTQCVDNVCDAGARPPENRGNDGTDVERNDSKPRRDRKAWRRSKALDGAES